jgi:hypothetical protein
MKWSRESLILTARLALLVLVAGGLTAAAAFAGPGDGDGDGDAERHVIRLEKRIDCEGEDCPEAGVLRKMIFVGEDGEVHELEGGGNLHWIAGEHHGMIHGSHGGHGAHGGYLGVMLTPMTPELRLHQGAPEAAGVLVSKVLDESPAWRAGVQVGDVISAVDGEAIASPRELAHAIRGRKSGETVSLEVWRAGSVQTLTTVVEEREGMGHPGVHRIEIRCEDGDCEGMPGDFEPFDCGGAEECEVQVRCTGDGCDCTVSGESADCAMIPGPHNER